MNRIRLQGTAEQRGAKHGEVLREQIAEGVAQWLDVLAARTRKPPHEIIHEFVQTTRFDKAIRLWTPDLLLELRALSHAALQPYATMLAFNLMDEEWWWTWKRGYHANPESGHRPPGCTTVGVRLGPRCVPILGQNMDLPRHYSDHRIVLDIESDDGPNAAVLSTAGMLAIAGCNDGPLAVCVNTLMGLNRSEEGLPVAFTIRRILQHGSAQEAVSFLHSIKHASGQNYAIADGHEIRDVECSASRTVEWAEEHDRLAHANHPLANQDLDPDYGGDHPNTYERQRAAESALMTSSKVGDLYEILRDRSVPICQTGAHPHSNHTFATIITELTSPPKMYVTQGPPHEHRLEEAR